MSFKGKFDTLCEEFTFRYQQGGLLVGDYVKFVKNYKNNPKIKERAQSYFDRIGLMAENDKPIKVYSVKSERAEVSNGVVGATDAPTGWWVDIATEYAPGLLADVITVPLEILEKIDTGNNFSPGIPASSVRKDTTQIKPHEVKQADPNRNLTTKNIKI